MLKVFQRVDGWCELTAFRNELAFEQGRNVSIHTICPLNRDKVLK